MKQISIEEKDLLKNMSLKQLEEMAYSTQKPYGVSKRDFLIMKRDTLVEMSKRLKSI